MATTSIPQLTQGAALTGAEQMEAVQGGSSVRVTTGQIAALGGPPGPPGQILNLLPIVGPAAALPPASFYLGYVAITTDQGILESNGMSWNPIGAGPTVPVLPGLFTYATLPPAVANPNVYAATSDKGAVYSTGATWLLLYNQTNATLGISTNTPLPGAVNGTAYSVTLTATNATAPVTWSIVSLFSSANIWPINSNTGVISLTPTHTETDSFMAQVIDATGAAAQKLFTITVAAGSLTPAATPTFSPIAGTYATAQTVTISCSTGGSSIFYTTNGSTPTTSSTPYTTPITVSATSTVQAIATASGFSQSAVGSAAYTITTAGAVYKFNPGDYAAGTQYAPTQTQYQSDITQLASNHFGVQGYVLGVWGFSLVAGTTFDNSISNAQGALGNYTGFATIGAAFNYLQTAIPGARMGILISWLKEWNHNAPTNNLVSYPVPGYVLNAPSGVLALPTNLGDANSGPTTWTSYTMSLQNHAFGGGGQYGWGLTGWNQSANAAATYTFLSPAFWDPCVTQTIVLAMQALSKYQLPAGSAYAGQTLDQCPLIEFIGSNDEVSYDFGIGADPYNPVGSGTTAPTTTNFHTNYFAWATGFAAAFPHTMVPVNISYGFGSHSSTETSAAMYTTYLPALSAITGIVMFGADSVATAWVGGQGSGDVQSSFAQQAFIGIQNPAQGTTLQPQTGTNRTNAMPNFAQMQPNDLGGTGHQASYLPVGITQATQPLVVAICAAWGGGSGSKSKPTHRLWWQTDATGSTTAFQGYIRPGFVSGVVTNSTRPTNLP